MDHGKYKLEQKIVNKAVELQADAITQQHMVIGGRIFKFCFKLENENDECARGTINLLAKKNDDFKFFIKPLSVLSLREFVDNVELSSKLRTPYLLTSRLVSLTYPNKSAHPEMILAYDYFDHFYENWIQQNHRSLFDKEDGVLSPWWRRQIRNLLCTIEYLHKKKVFHRFLNGISNYVIVGDDIHLINPGKDGSKLTDIELKDLTRTDILAFKSFLVHHVTSDYTSVDWKYFVDLFDVAGVGELKNHPVLMDEKEKIQYYQDIFDYIACSKLTATQRLNMWRTMDKYKPTQFIDWDTKIDQKSVMYVVYTSKTYDGNSMEDLLRFIRNLIKHCKDEQLSFDDDGEMVYSRADLGRDISSIYPGHLSYLHNTLVNHHPQFKITSE